MESGINKVLLGFIIIMLAAVLIPVITDLTLAKTTTSTVIDRSVPITSARIAANNINESSTSSNYSIPEQQYAWKQTDCAVSAILYGNASANWVLNTDYNVDANKGIIHIKNSSTTVAAISNTTLLDFTYCPDDYINQSFGRNILNLVGGMLVIMILAIVAIGLLYSGLKDMGIISK